MGSIPHENGVSFRVWAPNAEFVCVVGTFNNWDKQAHPMEKEENGYWYGEVSNAKAGDEYRYFIRNGEFEVTRIDPYAREVTNSVGNAIIHDGVFEWGEGDFQIPPINELTIYEMHVGTFGPGKGNSVRTFRAAMEKLDYLQRLGLNAL